MYIFYHTCILNAYWNRLLIGPERGALVNGYMKRVAGMVES